MSASRRRSRACPELVEWVHDHQESTRLQYGLTGRAQDLGWAAERVVVIDDDLGKSGASADGRPGFQRLVTEVSLDHVGIILGVEMSRLARSGKDWHQLLELCALFRTLIADPSPTQGRLWTASTIRPSTTIGCCWGSRER
jgi:DNA invertase Pin-like site-specific DNA recombinase